MSTLAERTTPLKDASSIYYTWCDRILMGTFTKGQCNQWAQAIVPIAQGERARGARTKLSQEEAADLIDKLRLKGGVNLTSEHAAKGLAYLRAYGAKRIGLPQDAIDKFAAFYFAGDTNSEDFSAHVPEWRFTTTDGREFAYYVTAWQSGSVSGWRQIR